MVTYHPVLEVENIGRHSVPVEENVENDHDQECDVEGRYGRSGVKVSTKCDEHPGGKYQNPRDAAQGDSH